jgi:DNA primase
MTANPNDRAQIDDLKARVDLVALLAAHGVQVKKDGKGHKACCPWHEDKTPSLSVDVKKGLYHCFSCGKAGDSLSFIQSFRKLLFPQALEELRKFAGDPHAPAAPKPVGQVEPLPFELLARVADIWHQAFCQRSEGLAYLERRGLKDKEMLRSLQAGYCDGEQLLAIAGAENRAHLQRVGIFNERGREFFSRCVVFPLKDKLNRVVGFYGRSTLANAKVGHRFCAGAKTGLFFPEAARGAQQVFLVEGVLDALALYQAGFPNVMAMGGTQGLSVAMLEHLKAEKVGDLVYRSMSGWSCFQ